jgi:hypothetical protein
VYASAKAYDVVEQIWPSTVNWVGNDDQPNDAQAGVEGDVNAAIAHSTLAEVIGKNYLEIALVGAGWPVMDNAAERVRVHLAGSVELKIGDRTDTLPTSPLLVSFPSGGGNVVISSFRFSENATDDMLLVLQYLMNTL